jgi:hypothetical protein
MARRSPSVALLILMLMLAACGAPADRGAHEVAPSRPRPVSPVTDPKAATRSPRAIATH